MNIIFSFQFVAQKGVGEKDFQTELDPVLSMLDALSETLCRKTGKSYYYHVGQLCDAPESTACRWVVVLNLGRERAVALHQFLQALQPLLSKQLPSCNLQWKLEGFEIS